MERIKMGELVTDILTSTGLSNAAATEIKKFARKFGLTGCDNLNALSEQVGKQISSDACLLTEVLNRVEHLYPIELKYSNDLDDESVKIAVHSYQKMVFEIGVAARKLQRYSEQINEASNTSKIYGLVTRLSHEHFMSNGCCERGGWDFPTVSFV